jgi:hypothetical protein
MRAFLIRWLAALTSFRVLDMEELLPPGFKPSTQRNETFQLLELYFHRRKCAT